MGKQAPNDVVGEVVDLQIGPHSTELEIHSYEFEWTSVTYKPNRVHVRASSQTSNRTEGIIGTIEFTVTEGAWRELNQSVRGDER